MSELTLEISDIINILEIETNIGNIFNNLEIETSSDRKVEIIAPGTFGITVYASDIIGLDNYLANFIDTYEIDCGTP